MRWLALLLLAGCSSPWCGAHGRYCPSGRCCTRPLACCYGACCDAKGRAVKAQWGPE